MTLAAVLGAGLGFAVLGALQAALESLAAGRLFTAADQVLATERGAVLARAARRGVHASQGPGSGAESAAAATSAAEAALVVQKLPFLVPALTRYGPARWRVMVMPAVIVMLVLPVSWVVALILLIAGPLIPLFMALVGMAAKEASQRQMVEIGDMNSLLIDRLSALTDIRLMDAGARTLSDFAVPRRGGCAFATIGGPLSASRSVSSVGGWNCSRRWGWRWSRSMSGFRCWARFVSVPGGQG